MLLVSVLSGGAASSREYFAEDKWDVVYDQCSQTYTNNDSIVFDNVSLVNGLLGFRVDWMSNVSINCSTHKIAETGVLLSSALGYNLFTGTATFDPGDLTLVIDTCPDE